MLREPDHDSAGEWTAHGLPGGLQPPIEQVKGQRAKVNIQDGRDRAEQRREELRKQRLEQLLGQLAVQRRIQVEVEVKIQVRKQVTTQPRTPVTTRLKILLTVLPDEQREVHRTTKPRLRREVLGPRFLKAQGRTSLSGVRP